MKIFFCLIAVSIFITACNSNSGSNARATTTPSVMNVNTSAPIPNKITTPPPAQAMPVATTTAAPVEEMTISNNNKSEKIILNPAHGLPGHRCDLTVGAPLNSAPATKPAANTPPATVTANPTNVGTTSPVVPTTTQPTGVKPKLNPAHGLPGHRCDLTVGAPLNTALATKPAANTPPATVTANPTKVVTTSPVVSNATQPPGVKPKLNPAHGLPFHDCAIEVGKPLKN